MSRRPKFAWTDDNIKKLKKAVRNRNLKADRDKKILLADDKHFLASKVPERVHYSELKKEINSWADFDKVIEDLTYYNKHTIRVKVRRQDKETGKMKPGSMRLGVTFKMSEKDIEKANKIVKEFNAKITKLKRSGEFGNRGAFLPEKITVDEIIGMSTSRKDVNKRLNEYKKFLKDGAEKLIEVPDSKLNIKLTKWQFDLMKKSAKEVSDIRAEKYDAWKEIEEKRGGGYTKGELRMDDGMPSEFKPVEPFQWSNDYEDIRKRFKMLQREKGEGYWTARTNLAKSNYMRKIEQIVGNTDMGRALIEKIEKLSPDEFYRVLKSDDDLFLLLYECEAGNSRIAVATLWEDWFPYEDAEEEFDKIEEEKHKTNGMKLEDRLEKNKELLPKFDAMFDENLNRKK